MNIETAVKKFHWLKLADDGVVEMYLDHHSMQSFRMCEAYFELSIMSNIKNKQRSWNLTFGILWHKMVELYYVQSKAGTYDATAWLSTGIKIWQEAEMDEFKEHKMYKMLDGLNGFIAMCAQYADFFASEVDRLRVIGVEITFGKNKEVPLGQFNTSEIQIDYLVPTSYVPVRCYLTGRIDFLMDSGSAIGPLDHKTTAFFKGNPAASYDPQEGMTGYVFAAQHIIKTNFPELAQSRKVDRIWMNFAQLSPEQDPLKRFKRVPLFKTEYQLEQYRLRQLRTMSKIFDLITGKQQADWNTAICNNMFHTACPYRNLHTQATASNMLTILNNDFVIGKEWNPEQLED